MAARMKNKPTTTPTAMITATAKVDDAAGAAADSEKSELSALTARDKIVPETRPDLAGLFAGADVLA
jgi:hypothetical protein